MGVPTAYSLGVQHFRAMDGTLSALLRWPALTSRKSVSVDCTVGKITRHRG